jgi:hypothetical protein
MLMLFPCLQLCVFTVPTAFCSPCMHPAVFLQCVHTVWVHSACKLLCSQGLQLYVFTVPATCRFYSAKRMNQHVNSDGYCFVSRYLCRLSDPAVKRVQSACCWFLTEPADYYLQCLMPIDLWIYPAVSVPASDCAPLPDIDSAKVPAADSA